MVPCLSNKIFEQITNMTIVRPYYQELTLVLGCGNMDISPLFQCCESSDKHRHNESYTIDPDVERNPSAIGEFGIDSVAFLPPCSFDTILFEAFMINAFREPETNEIITDNVCTISSLIYLLKENGVVQVSTRKNTIVVIRKQNRQLTSVDGGYVFCTEKDYLSFHDYCDYKLGFRGKPN